MSDYDDDGGDESAAQMLGGTNDWLMQIFSVLAYIAFLLTIIALCSVLTYCRGR